ncbi:hypothetical protein SEPCBS119000_001739 [Sporothrix epigloea]|uniref:Uncharacterized protein n=1 Tax=Sporothrix epigloea TaxID=1892477 RepID=A0ABP0DGA4_9PEZI
MSESEKQPSRVADVCVNVNGKPDSPPLLPVAALGAGATVQRQAPLPPVQTFDRRAVSLGDFQQDANPRGSVVLPFSSLPKKGPSNVIIYKDTPQTTFTPKFASPSGQFSPLLGMAVTIDRASAAPPAVCAHHHSFENQQTVPLYRRSEEYTRRSTRTPAHQIPELD